MAGFANLVAAAAGVVERIALGGEDLVVVLVTLKVSAIGKCDGDVVGLLRPQVAVGPHRVQRLDMLHGGDALGWGGFRLQGGDDLV